MKKLIILLIIISFIGCKKNNIEPEEPCMNQMSVDFEPSQIYGNEVNEGYIMSFINECTNFDLLLWDFGDGCTAYNTDQIVYHNYKDFGFYFVQVTATDTCGRSGIASQEVYVLKK